METALEPAVVAATIDVRTDFEFTRANRRSSDYIPLVAGALHGIAAQLFNEADETQALLVARFGGRVTIDSVWEFLPSRQATIVLYPIREQLAHVLKGGSLPETLPLATWRLQHDGGFIELNVSSVEFRQGSLSATVKALLVGSGFVLSTIVAIGAQGPVQRELSDYRVRQTITRTYQGEPCFSTTTFGIDARELMDATAHELNYDDDLPEDERRRRICLVQGMLQASGRYDGELDGVAGPLTRQGLRQLQQDHELTDADVSDVAVRRALLGDWLEAVRKMRE